METETKLDRLSDHESSQQANGETLIVFPIWSSNREDELELAEIHQYLSGSSDKSLERRSNDLTGVVAVLPSQKVGLDTLEFFEKNGLVVMEVPEDLTGATRDQVTNHIHKLLDELPGDFTSDIAQIKSAPSVPLEHYFSNMQKMSAAQEKELLDFVNNPNGINEGFW
jgi:hypothetical protein